MASDPSWMTWFTSLIAMITTLLRLSKEANIKGRVGPAIDRLRSKWPNLGKREAPSDEMMKRLAKFIDWFMISALWFSIIMLLLHVTIFPSKSPATSQDVFFAATLVHIAVMAYTYSGEYLNYMNDNERHQQDQLVGRRFDVLDTRFDIIETRIVAALGQRIGTVLDATKLPGDDTDHASG